jgi:hypothetical protein
MLIIVFLLEIHVNKEKTYQFKLNLKDYQIIVKNGPNHSSVQNNSARHKAWFSASTGAD